MIPGLMLLLATAFAPVQPARHRAEVCPGATYFYEIHHPKPYWVKHATFVCRIGDHVFYKESSHDRHH